MPFHQAAEQVVAGKGQPGPIKAKVHASRSKKMVLTFFDSNANYIVDAMGKFLKVFSRRGWSWTPGTGGFLRQHSRTHSHRGV